MSTAETQTVKKTIRAVASREGRWWIIRLPELNTVTQARTVGKIEAMARDLAALWLETEPSRIAIDVEISMPDSARVKWDEAKTLFASARRDEQTAAALSRDAIRELREQGLTYSDSAALLGISVARAHQLAHS